MFEIKMKARYVLHKRRLLLCGRLLSVYVTAICCVVCLLGGAVFLSGAVVIPFSEKLLSVVAGGFGFFAASAFLYLHFAGRLFFNALIFKLSDKSLGSPHAYLSFRVVGKYIVFVAAVFVMKILWAVFFYCPAFSVLFITVRSFEVSGCMPEMMLYAQLFAFSVLLVIGTAFFLVVSGRYFICTLLFLRNPAQKIREIIKTSAEFTCDRLFAVLYYRLNIFFKGKIYGKCMSAFLMSEIFLERKYYRGLGIEKAEMNQSIPRAF